MNWIISPAHNGLDYTKKAIKSFRQQDIGDVRILLILNAPTDGTLAWARTQYGRIDPLTVISLSEPTSVARAWNVGLDWVLKKNPYCLVVNNDVELLPETYRLLVEDGSPFITAVGVNQRDAFLRGDETTRRPNPDFSCFLIRQETFKKVGKFDENFKIAYCEDWDYHCRLHKAGILAECLDIPFLHHAAGTLKCTEKNEKEKIQKQAEKNREYFKSKWGFAGGSKEYYNYFKEKV